MRNEVCGCAIKSTIYLTCDVLNLILPTVEPYIFIEKMFHRENILASFINIGTL